MKKILVTGLNGKLGRKIFSEKVNKDYKCIFITRKEISDKCKDSNSYVVADLTNEDDIDEDLWGVDEVFHMAGATHERKKENYYIKNYLATRLLLKKAEKKGIKRFLYLSSQAIGKQGGAYSHSKELTERIICESSVNWTIIRPSDVYGEGMNDSISKLCKLLKRSWIFPIIGDGKYEINPVHIDDFVVFILRLLKCNNKKSYGKTYILAGSEPIPFKIFCKEYASSLGKKIIIVHLPVLLCKFVVYILSFFKITNLVPDQIDRLLLTKYNDIEQAILDYKFNPRKFTGRDNLL